MILILSQEEELNVNNISHILTRLNQPWFRLNGEDIPLKTRLSFSPTRRVADGFLENEYGERVKLKDIDTVWFRRRGTIQVQQSLLSTQQKFIQTESYYALGTLFHLLRDRFWINDFLNEIRAVNKGLQLHLANKIGLRCPDTLITTDPAEAIAFYDKHKGNVLNKAVGQMGNVEAGDNREVRLIYSNLIKPEMRESLEAVRYAPTLLQEYIPKELEFRVTIINRHVFPTAIESQKSEKTREDWRRYDTKNTPYYPYIFPRELNEKLLFLMDQLGLVYGAVDMILHRDTGEFVFLEVNPGGQWGWVEQMSGHPITETIVDMLISAKKRRAA